jgi:hypothetical protein
MSETSNLTDPIIAPPAPTYRIKFIIIFILCVGMGAWFGYDGFVNWPAQNDAAAHHEGYQQGDPLPHSQMDMGFQKVLMVLVPIIGIGVLAWCLSRSRGEYRLEGTTLHVPGHPPVELQNITTINKKNWDRKGLAYLTYEQGSEKGTIRIDDFAYQRGPTDEIFERIQKQLLPPENAPTA